MSTDTSSTPAHDANRERADDLLVEIGHAANPLTVLDILTAALDAAEVRGAAGVGKVATVPSVAGVLRGCHSCAHDESGNWCAPFGRMDDVRAWCWARPWFGPEDHPMPAPDADGCPGWAAKDGAP